MSDEMVLVPKALLSCATCDGLDVQDVLDSLTGSDWHSGAYVPQTAEQHRNQVLRKLIEKSLHEERQFLQDSEEVMDRAHKAALTQACVGEWLKSQMEEE